MLMAFYAVMRHNSGYLHLQLRDGFRPDKETIGAVFKVGFPAMVEQLVMRAGMIIYSKTVASLGTVAFATHPGMHEHTGAVLHERPGVRRFRHFIGGPVPG